MKPPPQASHSCTNNTSNNKKTRKMFAPCLATGSSQPRPQREVKTTGTPAEEVEDYLGFHARCW